MLRPVLLLSGFLLAGTVYAENLILRTELYLQRPGTLPAGKIGEILESPSTGKVFSAAVVAAANTTASFSLVNLFRFQESGFRVRVSSGKTGAAGKACRISSDIDWNFAEEGPYLASGTESFYEGTSSSGVRNLLPGNVSLLEVVKSKNADCLYIPSVMFSGEKKRTGTSIFRRGEEKEWEIILRITEEGKSPRIIRVNPVYHHRTFPSKTEPGEVQCRMYDFEKRKAVTVMNFVYCSRRGIRKDGTPVLEQISLSLSFEAPGKGATMQLADLISNCSDENAAYGKLPQNGGKRIRYQVFLRTGSPSGIPE